eukprot:gene18742-25560_t
MGYDPIWWGVINVVVIELGMIIPPIGINVFVVKGIAKDIPIGTIYRGVMPFVCANLVRLALLVLFPAISLWLPKTLDSRLAALGLCSGAISSMLCQARARLQENTGAPATRGCRSRVPRDGAPVPSNTMASRPVVFSR